MKRLFIGLVILAGITGLSFGAPVGAASVNNFHITDYAIEYELGRDGDNRSTLRTVETITAVFPSYDQNRGIERAIPVQYDGHPTNLRIDSVTDEMGSALQYSTYNDNGFKVVRIGNPDQFVYGAHTYKITYTQRDVTRFFKNTNADEFYWDTNGTDWKVRILNLDVKLSVDESLLDSLTGSTACYVGVFGSSAMCALEQSSAGVYATSAQLLAAGENITIAIGFKQGTFTEYQKSFWEIFVSIFTYIQIVTALLALIIGVFLGVKWYRTHNRVEELGTIVPEYIPPRDTSVSTAASIFGLPNAQFAAQLIDLAVRHYIVIREIKGKGLFRTTDYELEIIDDVARLLEEEQEILSDIFSGNIDVGARLKLSSLKSNYLVTMRISDNPTKLKTLINGKYQLRHRDKSARRYFSRWGWVLLSVGILCVSIPLVVLSLAAFLLGYSLYPLTDKGLQLKRYLLGFRDYIKVGEIERLKMLQSPQGAEKTGISDVNEASQIVKLYERALPYAVLFGQEKEWNKQLGKYYESLNSQPDWYIGSAGVFHAAAFTSAVHSFTTTASHSSASGGSSGGGSSGGGGGGGGGGGW